MEYIVPNWDYKISAAQYFLFAQVSYLHFKMHLLRLSALFVFAFDDVKSELLNYFLFTRELYFWA